LKIVSDIPVNTGNNKQSLLYDIILLLLLLFDSSDYRPTLQLPTAKTKMWICKYKWQNLYFTAIEILRCYGMH